MKGIVLRIVNTVMLFAVWGLVEFGMNAGQTLVTGKMAGKQFESSDTSYIATQLVFSGFHFFDFIISVVGLAVLVTIWYVPIKKALAALTATLLLLALLPPPAHAYYDQQDYSENYFILPNESAFFIPDVGDNKNDQASFGSESYLAEKKIAAKRFNIPHGKLPNSGFWANNFVPTGRLIIVDRTPVSREWVKSPHRGTDKTDQSFPCQSSEGLDITVGIAIGASVFEENAAKFLFRFGVNPPTGDRKDPQVIFTSVYYGKSLAQVMDGPVRSRVQALVCDQLSSKTLDEDNKQAAKIMADIQKSVQAYMADVGISLDFIGWADTFEFDNNVQASINRRYIASQDLEIAKAMAPHTSTLQALATAEGTRTVANKWNGALPSSVSLWWLPSSISDWFAKAVTKGDSK